MSRPHRLSSIAETSGRTFVRFIAASYERLRRKYSAVLGDRLPLAMDGRRGAGAKRAMRGRQR